MEITLLIILLLIIASAFFSGSETALTATSRALMHQLEQEGDKRAATVNQLLAHRERLIGTILIGNNLVNIGASAMATGLMIELFGDSGIALATGIMTLLVLLFAEILPKTYALTHTTRLARAVAPVMRILVFLLTPISFVIQKIVRVFLVFMRVDTKHVANAMQVLAELRGVIDLKMGFGSIREEKKHERAMLRSVLDLAEVSVEEVAVHRRKVVTVNADLPVSEIIDQVAGSPYTRIPLWRDRPENIIGVVHAKALLRAIHSAGGEAGNLDILALAAKPWFIPDTTTLLDQLNAFRDRREHFALVVDEYGTLVGVVTLEDILEEIVGDIGDETDIPVAGVRPDKDGSYMVEGSVTLRDLSRELDWQLPDEKASTVAGLILHEARTIPDLGQTFMFHGFRFQVVRRNRNQLTLICVTPPKPAGETDSSNPTPR
jgi:Mg2+/Co2+ transporter CorB